MERERRARALAVDRRMRVSNVRGVIGACCAEAGQRRDEEWGEEGRVGKARGGSGGAGEEENRVMAV